MRLKAQLERERDNLIGRGIGSRNASAVFVAYHIFGTNIDQFFRTEQPHLQPYPALAGPYDHAWNSLHSAADHEGTFPGIEPDDAVAGLHALARDSDKAGSFNCSLA